MNNESEIDRIAHDLAVLRRAIKTNSPLIRGVVASPFFAWLCLPLGVFILVFCVGSHFLIADAGSWNALPAGWKTFLWSFIIVFMAGGGLVKILFLRRRAATVDREAGLWSVLRGFYTGTPSHLYLPALLTMAAGSAFAIWIGHPWYIVPVTAVSYAFACNSIGVSVGRPEYLASGWYALVTGLASLFFLERAPWLMTAAVYGGMFLVFAAVGLMAGSRRKGGKNAVADTGGGAGHG